MEHKRNLSNYKYALIAIIASLFISVKANAERLPPPPDKVAKITLGKCYYTEMKLKVYNIEGKSRNIPIKPGCRCTLIFNGIEFITTVNLPPQLCGTKSKKSGDYKKKKAIP